MGLKKGWSQLGILFAAIASIQLPLPVYHRPLWPWPAGEGSEVGMLPYVPGGMHCSIGQITACQQWESLPSPALGWLHYGRHVPVGGQRSGCSPVPTCITSMYTAHPLQPKYAHVFSPQCEYCKGLPLPPPPPLGPSATISILPLLWPRCPLCQARPSHRYTTRIATCRVAFGLDSQP